MDEWMSIRYWRMSTYWLVGRLLLIGRVSISSQSVVDRSRRRRRHRWSWVAHCRHACDCYF
jgi:hypothetical protein